MHREKKVATASKGKAVNVIKYDGSENYLDRAAI
jgi:hypothetical protein